MKNEEQNQSVPKGYTLGPVQYFSGNVYLKNFVSPDEITNCSVADVLFEPGVRNNWHIHPSNQILMVNEGVCYYQEEGKKIQAFEAGEVINILPGIKHWHGASPNGIMKHTAININTDKGMVTWLEPVTDEEYNSFKNG